MHRESLRFLLLRLSVCLAPLVCGGVPSAAASAAALDVPDSVAAGSAIEGTVLLPDAGTAPEVEYRIGAEGAFEAVRVEAGNGAGRFAIATHYEDALKVAAIRVRGTGDVPAVERRVGIAAVHRFEATGDPSATLKFSCAAGTRLEFLPCCNIYQAPITVTQIPLTGSGHQAALPGHPLAPVARIEFDPLVTGAGGLDVVVTVQPPEEVGAPEPVAYTWAGGRWEPVITSAYNPQAHEVRFRTVEGGTYAVCKPVS